MIAKRYALLDPAAIGLLLELRDGREAVTYDTPAIDDVRHVRADIGFSGGQHAFAVAFWLSDPDQTWSNTVRVGLATEDADLATGVGDEIESIGYLAQRGRIRGDADTIADVAAAQPRQRITVEVDLDASPQTVTWSVDGLAVYTAELPPARTWYPAISIGGTEAYGISCIFNGGRRVGEIASEYVWAEDLPSIGNFDLAPVLLDYRTGPGDTPANAAFVGDVLNAAEVGIHSAVTWWPLGSDRAALRSTALRLQNREGRYDALLAFDGRGAEVKLYDGNRADDFASQRLVATLIVDGVRAAAGRVIEITLASPLRALEAPWQRRLLPPWVDEPVANRPWPVVIGAARNVPPLFIGRDVATGEAQYIAHDGDLAVAQVRDGGDPLEIGVDPATYAVIDGGVQLYEDPEKLLTIDCSAVGLDAASFPDALGGEGEFEVDTNADGIPDGWIKYVIGTAAGTDVQRVGSAGDYAVRFTVPTDPMRRPCLEYDLISGDGILVRTKNYVIEFDVIAFTGTMPRVILYIIEPGGTAATPIATWWVVGVGSYKRSFSWASIDPLLDTLTFGFCVVAQSTGPSTVDIARVYAREIPPVSIGAESLEGVGLADYVRQTLQRLPDAVPVIIADAEAIDTATGYQVGAWLNDAGSTLDVLQRGERAFTAAHVVDETGSLRFARLLAPEDVADIDLDFVIESDQTMADGSSEPLPELLQLPGLTTSYGARHNWAVMSPGDFVADVDPVTGVPLSVRTQFQRRSQRILQASGSLAAAYLAADRGDVVDTVHEDTDLAQAEADRLAAYAARPRWMVRNWRIAFPGEVPLLRAGMVGRITYPLHGFAAGRKVQILECELRPWGGSVTLTVIY